ncbi:MarR family winged helix-turn-helix transcriptional regulator [Floccifex sp.]|uniref:MarR family winged helix-turn-helix transcriptional regulator n=1 Tax=Floccifex sp. TaxID=2815810 RepID=UPI003EFC1499
MITNDVGYLIKSINDKLKAKADAELKQFNLTMSQCRVLTFLSSHEGQATQKQIEVFLDVSHPTVVGIVSRMEQNGFVKTWQCEDKRNKKVILTPQALSIDKQMQQNLQDNEQRLLKSLSIEQGKQLVELLQMVLKNLAD